MAGIAGLAALMLARTNGSLSAQQPFAPLLWRQAGVGWVVWHPSERKTMLDDLLESRTLIGLHTAEVIALLGTGRVTRRGEQQRISYSLGPRSFSLGAEDTLYLGVELENGVVYGVYVFEALFSSDILQGHRGGGAGSAGAMDRS